jgi:hypothetical protein
MGYPWISTDVGGFRQTEALSAFSPASSPRTPTLDSMAQIALRNEQNETNGVLARHRSKYTEIEIDAGLTAVAMASGNTRRAAKALVAAGQRPVPQSTLKRWVDRIYPQRYRQIQERTMPELNAQMAEVHDQLVIGYSDLQQQALEKAREGLPNAKASEAAGVFKSAAIAAGINTEKGLLRRGQPTQITQTGDPIEMLRRLQQRHPNLVQIVEGSAEEVTESDRSPNMIEFSLGSGRSRRLVESS